MRTISHEFARRSVIRDEAGRVVKRRKGYMGHVIIICQAIVHGCEEEAAEIEQQQQIFAVVAQSRMNSLGAAL